MYIHTIFRRIIVTVPLETRTDFKNKIKQSDYKKLNECLLKEWEIEKKPNYKK